MVLISGAGSNLQAIIDRCADGSISAQVAAVISNQGWMLNIHPSLLPLYPGLDTHQRALADGVKNHGASVHFVTAELDGGPILIQGHVPVEPHDTPETLAQRVHAVEHQIYPQAIAWFAKGRLRLSDGRAMLDGMPVLVPDNIQEAFISLSTEPEQ